MKTILMKLGLIGLLFGSACRTEEPILEQKLSELNIEERMRHYKVQGASIAIIKDFTIVSTQTYGVKDALTRQPVEAGTLFQAASVSKPVVAMAALLKVQEQKIGLEEDVNQKLTSWKVPENQYTTRAALTLPHLLSHTGGINVSGFPGYPTGHEVPTLQHILNGALPATNSKVKVEQMPGQAYKYSGGGYCIVQQLLMDLGKKPFPEIMRESVFEKLDMKNSFFEQPLPATEQDRATSGHYRDGSRITGENNVYPELAAGGLWTTAEDLARFVLEIQLAHHNRSSQILSPASAHLMLTPYKGIKCGLGVYIDQQGPDVYFSHDGANVGYQCKIIAHTKNGYGAVVLTNSDNGKFIEEVFKSISLEYAWENYPF